MKSIKFGIIGLGRQGKRFANHFLNNDIKNGELILVCRRSKIGENFAKKNNLRYFDNIKYATIDTLPQAVIITTPSYLHGQNTIAALEAGKHVLVDKPVAATVKEAIKIIKLSKKYKLSLTTCLPLRYDLLSNFIKKNLYRIGTIKKLEIKVCHGSPRQKWQKKLSQSIGGVIMDLGNHYFDIVSFFLNKPIDKIISVDCDIKKNENYCFIDLACGDIKISVNILRNQKKLDRSIICYGSKGYIKAQYLNKKAVIINNDRMFEYNLEGMDMKQAFVNIIDNFIKHINSKQIGATYDFLNAVNSLNVIETAYKTFKTKKTHNVNKLKYN